MKVVSLTTHPIQYQVPVFRALAADPEIEFTSLFLSDHPVRGGHDSGFGRVVSWDVPILEGYEYEFLPNLGSGNEGKGFWAYRAKELRKKFGELGSDVLLLPGHSVWAYWQAVRAARECGMIVIVKPESLRGVSRKRSWIKAWVRKHALRWFYSRVDLFCSTGFYATEDARDFEFLDEDIFSTPYHIDSELLESQREQFGPTRSLIRGEIGMQETDVGLVFCGKFIDWKNPDLILDAVERLPDGSRNRAFPILIGDGVNQARVVNRCRQILGEGRFCCPGFVNQSELGRYYTAGDLFILPSKRGHESWGLVVNEAMTFGLPCLVSDGVGCRTDLVGEGGTGRIFEDGDSETLAKQIEKLILDDGLRQHMGEAAYRHIRGYSTENAVAGLRKALHRASTIKLKKEASA